jgi:dTMP kinase
MADSKQGRFITLEGIEGVGKSTNMELVSSLIKAAGYDVVVTREPGGTELGERIREVVLMHSADVMPTSAELLLMFAARAIHIENKIAPALSRGDWVVCDRFTDATYAYQGGGRGADIGLIETLELSVQGDLQPDLTLLLDADPEIGMRRALQRGEADRFETEKLAFFDKIRAAYLQRAAAHPERIVVIDAAKPLSAVQADIEKHINNKL